MGPPEKWRSDDTAAGSVVAVRRLSKGDGAWRLKEVEAEVESIGKEVEMGGYRGGDGWR